MVLAAVLFFEVILFIEMKRRIKIVTAVDCIFIFIMLYQYFYYFAEFYGYAVEESGALLSFYTEYNNGVIFYLTLYLIVYSSTFGLKIEADASAKAELTSVIAKALKYQGWFMAAFYVVVLIYLLAVNHGMLWENREYLVLRRRDSLVYNNTLTAITLPLMDPIGVMAAFFWSVSLFLGRFRAALAATPLFLFGLAFQLANSSRTAVVLLIVPAAIGWIVLERGRLLVSLGFLLTAVYVLSASLGGRVINQFGIGSIGAILATPLDGSYTTPSQVLFNLLQGIFVTMDGFMVPGEHPEIYKILSFSPLPSFIDGFDQIKSTSIISLGAAVPMSAVTEAVRFGPVYAAIGALLLFLFLRQSIKSARISPLIYIFTVPATMMLFVQINAYPVRNVFRQAVYVYAFMLIASHFAKKRRRLTKEAVAAAPVIARYRQQAGLAPAGRRPSPPLGRLP